MGVFGGCPPARGVAAAATPGGFRTGSVIDRRPGGALPGVEGSALDERRILSHQHRDIDRIVDRIETLGEMAGNLASPDLASVLDALLGTMERSLLPHLEWEEQVCYPDLDRLAGTAWATRVLRLEHEDLREAIGRLQGHRLVLRHEPTYRHLIDLRAHLYRLHALLRAHLEQEEFVALFLCEAPPAGDGGQRRSP